MNRLAILGGGRAAWAYGSEWRKIGWPIAGVWLREESQSRVAEMLQTGRRSIEALASDADLILVAVSDRAIEEVAAQIPETGAVVFHASGALTSVRGGFSLHPLKSLPPVGAPTRLDDALLVFEGAHRETASGIAAAVGARFAEISAEHKMLYHAGAVFGSNYVALMLDLAERLIGIDDARDDLVALAQSAMANWRAQRGRARFTGPAVRGDSEVIDRHIRALAVDPQLAQIYELLADEIAGVDPCEG
jgi:predicted short-subunit dehydrogenase-like oxidoreductase (DUF2520 family)